MKTRVLLLTCTMLAAFALPLATPTAAAWGFETCGVGDGESYPACCSSGEPVGWGTHGNTVCVPGPERG